MVRLLTLVLLLFVVGQATGSIEFALDDACQTASAPCDASCPACVLCSCCSGHSATSQSLARVHDRSEPIAFVSCDAGAVPASHRTSPPRHPPKSAQG